MTLRSRLALGRPTLRAEYEQRLEAALQRAPAGPGPLLEEAALHHLPPPVQRFVRASGAVGRPRVRSFRLAFDAEMFRAPGGPPLASTSVQHNEVAAPSRLFFMQSRMFGLPVQVLHDYAGERATFRVRVASLVDVVDERGAAFSRAETVTVLNDLCCFAPGALVDDRLAWAPLDDRAAQVTFRNGVHQVSATLLFNERDELVDFTSDDRPQISGGVYHPYRWSTPLGDHRWLGGLRLPTRGEAVYATPQGPFTYGRFTLRSLSHDGVALLG